MDAAMIAAQANAPTTAPAMIPGTSLSLDIVTVCTSAPAGSAYTVVAKAVIVTFD